MTKYIVAQRPAALILVATLLVLGGCAAKGAPEIYQWQGYQKNVDTYFRGDQDSISTQAHLMEEDLQKIHGQGGAVPPGFQAHMGLLYGKQGNEELLKQKMEDEKKQFPESATFVDYLLRNFKK